jgi:hypothetical protein
MADLLTPAQALVVLFLLKYPRSRCSEVGAHLWGDQLTNPQSFARPAGAILAHLRKKGIIARAFSYKGEPKCFYLTSAGHRAAEDERRNQ